MGECPPLHDPEPSSSESFLKGLKGIALPYRIDNSNAILGKLKSVFLTKKHAKNAVGYVID